MKELPNSYQYINKVKFDEEGDQLATYSFQEQVLRIITLKKNILFNSNTISEKQFDVQINNMQ